METKIVTTPVDKYKIELKSFITGREKRELKSVYLRGMKVDVESAGAKAEDVDMAKITNDAEDRALITMIVSINGEKNKIKIGDHEAVDILDAILSMNSKDYDFVVEEVNKISRDDDFLDKSKKVKDIIEQVN